MKKFINHFILFSLFFTLCPFSIVRAAESINVALLVKHSNKVMYRTLKVNSSDNEIIKLKAFNTSETISDAKEKYVDDNVSGVTGVDVLARAKKDFGFDVVVKEFDFGPFVQRIDNVDTPDNFSKFWNFAVDGKLSDKGIADTEIHEWGEVQFYFASYGTDPPEKNVNISFDNDSENDSSSQGSSDNDSKSGDKKNVRSAQLKLSDKFDHAKVKAIYNLAARKKSNGMIENEGVTDWAVMALSSNFIDSNQLGFPKSVKDYVLFQTLADPPMNLLDLARRTLSIVSLGRDPRDFGRRNFINEMKLHYQCQQFGDPNLVNDDIFGLMAFLAAEEDPDSTKVREALEFIKSNQNKDGGFSYQTHDESSVDMTAAAIQVMEYARDKDVPIILSENLYHAKKFLKDSQRIDGGFGYLQGDSESNSASTSWAIQALRSMNTDPQKWKKNNVSPYDALLSFQKDDGSFSWRRGTESDALMTAYALLALSTKPLPVKFKTQGMRRLTIQ